MDFAPYQNTAPEGDRPASPRSRSLSPKRSSRESPALPDPNEFGDDRYGLPGPDYNAGSLEAGGLNVNLFETSLIRLDYEAMLAYLLLPPAGAVLLLIVEHRNDYVRFHAWQSSMLFSATFVLHLILSWSSVLSWLLFAMNMCLIGFLALRAYRDAVTLERFEFPYIGRLASSFVDSE